MRFVASADGSVQPCLSRERLQEWGIDVERLDRPDHDAVGTGAPRQPLPAEAFCDDLARYVPEARIDFDSGELKLAVSVPQLYMRRNARGWVDPAQWDSGVTAAMLGYDASVHRGDSRGRATDSGYLGLRAGVNLGGWRLRHNGSLSWGTERDSRYQASSSYAQRDITALRSQLVLGQTSTAGLLFPSVGLTGMRLYSDERMLPESMRDYAPTVRGVAATNAKVTITQRGYVLLETTVAPGPFEIDDLYPTGYGGDLEVVVTEADGREQRFSVPFASVAQLLRAGTSRYSVSAGRVRELGLDQAPYLFEATWQRGMSNAVTGYGGVLGSEGYQAAQLGAAFNTPIGAVAADVTASRTALPAGPGQSGRRLSGQSARVTFSKLLPGSGTNFSLAAYRYSTDGYLDLGDALRLRQGLARDGGLDRIARQRSRMELNIGQDLGPGRGRVWVQGSSSTYWNRGERRTSYTAGYSQAWRGINFGFTAQRSRVSEPGFASDRLDNQYSFTLSVPLGGGTRRPMLSSTLSHGSQRGSEATARISASPSDRFSYGASATYRDSGVGTAFNGNASYRTSAAAFSGNYSQGQGYRQVGVGMRGGIVAYPGGVALAQDLGETIGVVSAPGAAGARLSSASGVKLDARGNAVVPYLSPYRINEVSLDPKGLPLEVELDSTTTRVAPRAGAVVVLPFITRSGGRAALIDARQPDGSPLPFGADVFDAQDNPVGVVGQASRLWLRGIEEQGSLTVKWGRKATQQCRIDYRLPERTDTGQPALVDTRCVGAP